MMHSNSFGQPRGARGLAAGGLAVWLLLLACTGCQDGRWRTHTPLGAEPVRAIWVTRWDYRRPADIVQIMDNVRAAGFNTVLFQVRGNGTVCYPSQIEPWAEELGVRDPGFDPLNIAITEAHRRGLALHAWVNVIPGWRGERPPTDRRQLYNAHPDWFWRDAAGRRQPLGWYVSINPCYPEVRRYLTDVMHEIVSRYPVDGLHLDYIRFPNEWNESYPRGAQVPDYPRDPRTLAMFKSATGKMPEQAPRMWDAFRTEAITRVVRDIRWMMQQTRPRAALTAAVGSSPEEARRRHFQDAVAWIREGLVDAVFPMNYAENMRLYEQRLVTWRSLEAPVVVVMGVKFDKRDADTVTGQVDRAHRAGGHFCAFAYNSLFERLDEHGRPVFDAQSRSRAGLRRAVIPYLQRL